MCEQLAHGCHLVLNQPGIKPGTSQSAVQHATTTPPSHICYWVNTCINACIFQHIVWVMIAAQRHLQFVLVPQATIVCPAVQPAHPLGVHRQRRWWHQSAETVIPGPPPLILVATLWWRLPTTRYCRRPNREESGRQHQLMRRRLQLLSLCVIICALVYWHHEWVWFSSVVVNTWYIVLLMFFFCHRWAIN